MVTKPIEYDPSDYDPSIDNAYIGKRIRQARKNTNPEQTQGDLAELVSIITGEKYSQDQVSRWEHGMSLKPAILNAVRLAQGQPLRYYFGGEGLTNPTPGQSDFKLSQRSRVLAFTEMPA